MAKVRKATGGPHTNSVNMAHKKARVEELVAAGSTVSAALKDVGRSWRSYETWRKNDSEWATRMSLLVAARRSGEDATAEVGLVGFRKLFFGYDTAPHHFLIAEMLERSEPGELNLVLAFPQAAKTSVMVDWMSQTLALDPTYRIAVITEGQDLARKIIGQVAQRMTDEALFPAYIQRYGPFRTPAGQNERTYAGRTAVKPWSADFLQVYKSSHDEKEPSLEARGAGSALYGGRYDRLVLDDIQSDRSINQTATLLRYIRQTVLTRPDKDRGSTVGVGSRVGVGDVYQAMIEEDMIDRLVTIPALSKWVERDEHFTIINGKVVVNPDCPATATWHDLRYFAVLRRKLGEDVWARTFMQRTVSEADATFTEPMLDNVKNRERTAGPQSIGTFKILTVDPGLDTGVCAYLAAAGDGKKLWLLDQHAKTDTRRYEDIFAHIATLAAQHRPSYVVIEQNNFQKGLLQDDRLIQLRERFGFQVVPHQTTRNKHDPVLGVAMMASAFTDREIDVPWGDDTAKRTFGPLLDELRLWRPTKRGSELKQDRVMTLWFAWLHWQQLRAFYNPSSKPQLRRQVPSWMAGRARGLHAA